MISYSASNVLFGRVAAAAPYWGACGIDLLALAVAGRIATNTGEYLPPPEARSAVADLSATVARGADE
jgi:hypothetical protein